MSISCHVLLITATSTTIPTFESSVAT